MKRIFTLIFILSAVNTIAQPVEETIITGNFPNPAAIETLDFNQNGQDDIIVAGGGTIRWYENDNGDFVAHDILDSLNSIWDFDLVDFNGNTEWDIVAINDYSNTLFWLENDGNMNFTYHVLTDTLVDLERVKAIDANQNGLVDIFFTIYDGSYFKLYMWENTGTGFDAKYVDRIDYRDIHLFDYEDDGDYDLLTKMNYYPFDTEEIGVLVNDGSNNFTEVVLYEHTGNIDISDVRYVDLDNDSDGDLVIVDHIQDELFWLENCEIRHDILTGQAAFSLEVLDFDNDGVLDIVIDDADADVLELYKGSNPGASMSFALQNTYDTGSDARHFVQIDADQDALIDFAYLVTNLDEISVMYNQDSFNFDQLKLSTSVAEPDCLRQVDLDNDGDLDIVCFPDDEHLAWFEKLDNGTYKQHIVTDNIDNAGQLEVHDINNDGYLDIISTSISNARFSIWYNDGSQNFTEFSLVSSASQVSNPKFFSIADLDNDGDEDFVIVGASISSYNPKGIFWIRNEGAGVYSNPIVIEDDLNMMGEVVTHDFDDDGLIDIVVAKDAYGSESLKLIKNYGGVFAVSSPVSFDAETVRLGDINNDGLMDFVCRNDEDNDIVWFESHGDFTFTEHTIPMSETRDVEFEICDHGNDGITDIFFYTNYYGFTNSTDFTAGILINDGSQNFSLSYFLQNTTNMNSGIAFDKEMDGDIDFFLAFDADDKISFFENMAIDLNDPEVTSWPTASDIDYGQTLDQSVLSGGSAVAAGSFEFVNPLDILNTGTHTVQVKFVPDDAATYHQAFGSTSITVHAVSPTVNTWPIASDIEYGQSLEESVLSGGDASVPGVFSFDNPSVVPGLGVYTADLTFTPDDAVNYTTVSGTVDVTVNQATPTVSDWPTASAITYGEALSASILSGGTASVPGTFSFDNLSTMPDAGIYTADVTFTPDDAVNYTTVSGTVDVTVNQASTTVSDWPTASAITYGEALSASILSGGTASVPGTFSFDNPATMPDAGIYTADVTFTPDDAVNYTTVSGTVDVAVNQATPTVSDWPTASAITYGEALSASILSGGTASVPGTFSFDNPATMPDAGIYTADVTFTPDDVVNYTTVSGTVDVTVNQASTTVSDWPTASAITYGEALSASILSGGTASVTGTFSFDHPATTPDAGNYSADVTFIPEDAANYTTVSGSVDVAVNQATPTVSDWPTASAITFGEALSASTLSGGTASVTGTFSFDHPATTPDAGNYSADVTFIPDDAANYTTVSGSVDVAVNQATPTVSDWPTASAITFGEALSASTLSGGTASVTGTFSFDNPATTPDAGNYSADVTFIPEDAANYTTVSGTVDVTVNQATPTVSDWPTASAITFGEALYASTLSGGTASVTGTFSFDNQATMPDAGIYTADVTFTPDDAVNYTTVSGTVDVTVNQASTTVSDWPTASAITYGEALSASTLSGGTASVTGTFSFDHPATTPDAGNYSADVTFIPEDAANYTTVSGSVDVAVDQATQVITWDQDLTGLEIGSVITLNASASSALTVTYESDNTDVAIITGNSLEIISSGVAVITASQTGNENYEAAEPIEKSLDIPVGILTTEFASELTMYPVPAQTFIMLETTLEGEKSFKLYDVSGKLISDGKFFGADYELNIRNLTQGQYIIRLQQGNIVLSESFVKQ